MMLFTILLVVITCYKTDKNDEYYPCTYTQAYWSNTSISWPEKLSYSNVVLMCGISWRTLMSIDPVKMAIPSNMYWIITFHQYATIRVNIENIEEKQQSPFDITVFDNLTQSISFIGDSIERSCNNISGWPLYDDDDRNLIYNALNILRDFNTGIIGPGSCIEEFHPNINETTLYTFFSDISSTTSPFYYYNTPDLIVIPADSSFENNNTIIYSLLKNEYKFRQFTLSSSIIACFILIPILSCTIACIANRRRKFFLAKKNKKNFKDNQQQQQEIEYDESSSSYTEDSSNSIKLSSHIRKTDNITY